MPRHIMATHIVEGSVEGGAKLRKYLRELSVRLGEGGEASIGFLEGRDYPSDDGGLPVAQVAFWNEFGTKTSPPRPFFRRMIEEEAPTWARKLGAAARYAQYRPKQTLEIVAADIQGHLIKSINDLVEPKLAQSTIDRKGFSKPLIETSVMVDGTGWVVKTGLPVRV